MADLSKVKIGEVAYNLKDAGARDLIGDSTKGLTKRIADEETTRANADTALDIRVQALEARGRYLSTWNAADGSVGDYPQVPSTETGLTYTYTFKSGDYYIINNVPTSGTKYMPDGASFTATRESTEAEWVWEAPGKKAYSGSETLVVGGQFVYSTTGWNYVATAKDVTWGSITGTLSQQTDLQTALNAKANTADLGDLAFKDSASGTVDGQTISGVKASYTPAGTITLGDFTQTSTDATLTKAAYTPAGFVNVGEAAADGKVVIGGSINVTVKDAAAASDITNLEYENYTPAGTIAATTGGSFSALKSATFGEDSTNGVQIEGTVSKPAVNVNDDTTDTFVKSLKAGSVDAAAIDTTKFSGGSFTGASAASFTQGSKASFTQGAKAALTTSDISYIEEGVKVAIDSTDTEMLVFTNVTAKSAKAVNQFTANGDDTFVANGDDSFTANNVGTFTAAAINDGFFSAEKLPVVDATAAAVTAVSAELAEAPAFTGKKYKVATTDDTALKEVAFTGTAAAVKLSGAKYLKQEIDDKTFTPSKANLSFAGTEVANFQVTGVKYDKATANGATFAGTAGEASVGDIAVAAKAVTVS